jgi:hypothetical protein
MLEGEKAFNLFSGTPRKSTLHNEKLEHQQSRNTSRGEDIDIKQAASSHAAMDIKVYVLKKQETFVSAIFFGTLPPTTTAQSDGLESPRVVIFDLETHWFITCGFATAPVSSLLLIWTMLPIEFVLID